MVIYCSKTMVHFLKGSLRLRMLILMNSLLFYFCSATAVVVQIIILIIFSILWVELYKILVVVFKHENCFYWSIDLYWVHYKREKDLIHRFNDLLSGGPICAVLLPANEWGFEAGLSKDGLLKIWLSSLIYNLGL